MLRFAKRVLSLGAVTVTAFVAGDVTAIDDVEVQQRSGPFLQEAWEVLRTVPPGQPDTYAAFAARCGHPSAVRAAANAALRSSGSDASPETL